MSFMLSGNILKREHLVIFIIILLSILTISTYWQVQDYEFIDYDDQLYVTNNYRIQADIGLKSIVDTVKDVHTGHGHWHPLTMLSHMLDWQMFGKNAGGHHWTNAILHAGNAILLFVLFWMMTGAVWRSAFVSALFAIHPINVESVAWIAERKNVLSAFFWFLTMICYVRYVRSPGWKQYLPVLICFLLGLMSKAMLVTLPFALLLIDYWPLNRTNIGLQIDQSLHPAPLKKEKLSVLIVEKIPLFVVAIVFTGLALHAAQSGNAFVSPESAPITDRVVNAIVSYALYIKKMFWPTDLTVFYPRSSIPLWQTSLAAALLIAATAIACKHAKDYPYFFVGWFWYLGTLVPVIGLVQVGDQSMADRYAYVPFIGLFVIIAWLSRQLCSKMPYGKICASFLFIIIIVILTISTYGQIGIWRNTRTLFVDAVRINPENYTAYNILGSEEAGKGNHEKALRYYQMSLKINPKFARAYSNAGNSFLALGRYREANDCYEKAIAISDRLDIAHYNLGVLKLLMNSPHEAVKHFKKALTITPGYFNAHFNLGVVSLKLGNVEDAVKYFEKALELNSKSLEAQKGLLISRDMQKK